MGPVPQKPKACWKLRQTQKLTHRERSKNKDEKAEITCSTLQNLTPRAKLWPDVSLAPSTAVSLRR